MDAVSNTGSNTNSGVIARSRPKTIVRNGIYNGAFVADAPTERDINQYEKKVGEPLDIVVFFHALGKGFDFPYDTCDAIYAENNRAPFIQIEPWSWAGKRDLSYPLSLINTGILDGRLGTFARGAAIWRKPIFMSFAHEMNTSTYPWSGEPKAFIAAFRRMVDIFKNNKATNVTWVWNIDVHNSFNEYWPGDDYVDYIGLTGFSDEDSKAENAAALFGKVVSALKSEHPGKPIIIAETAFDTAAGSRSEKNAFAKSLVPFAKANDLAGFCWFNVNIDEDHGTKKWALGSSAKALSGAIEEEKDSFSTKITAKH